MQVLASRRTWSQLSPTLRSALRRHSSVLGTFKLKGVETPQEVVHLADDLLALRPYLAPRCVTKHVWAQAGKGAEGSAVPARLQAGLQVQQAASGCRVAAGFS
jgi:hypothetical protein